MPFFKSTTADTATASAPSSSSDQNVGSMLRSKLERNQKQKLLGEKLTCLKLLEHCQEFQVEELMGLLGSFDSSAEVVYDIGSLEKALELAKVMFEMDQLRTSTRVLDQTIEKLQDESFLNKVKVKMLEEIFKKLAYDLNKWDPDLACVSLSFKEPKSKDQTCSTTSEESNSTIESPKKKKKSKRKWPRPFASPKKEPQRCIGRTWSNHSIKDDDDQESVSSGSSEEDDDEDYGYGKAVPDAELESEQQQQGPPQPDYGYGDAAPDTDYGYEDAEPEKGKYGYGDAAPDYGYGDAAPDILQGSFELEGDYPSSQTSANKPKRRSSLDFLKASRDRSNRNLDTTDKSNASWGGSSKPGGKMKKRGSLDFLKASRAFKSERNFESNSSQEHELDPHHPQFNASWNTNKSSKPKRRGSLDFLKASRDRSSKQLGGGDDFNASGSFEKAPPKQPMKRRGSLDFLKANRERQSNSTRNVAEDASWDKRELQRAKSGNFSKVKRKGSLDFLKAFKGESESEWG